MDLRQVAEVEPTFPPVLFVHLGTPAEGEAFFAQYDPGARAIADPSARLYVGFGLERGGWKQLLGPEVWACGLRASRKGHRVGWPIGDPRRMPGFFLVEPSGRIVWSHVPRHAGDHPGLASIPRS